MEGLGKGPEAAAAYRRALAIQENLAADFPAVPAYRTDLAGSYAELWEPAEKPKAVGRRAGLVRQSDAIAGSKFDPQPTPANRSLATCETCTACRAEALTDLHRHAEAVKDWDRAIELDDGPNRPRLRLQRAMIARPAGDHAKAAAEAEVQAAGDKVTAATLYDCACVFAICSAGCKDDVDRKKQYADRAMAVLTKAVAAGYADPAHLTADDDLATLRNRDDFKALVAGLEKAHQPKPPSAGPPDK